MSDEKIPEVLGGYLLKKGEHLNAAYKRRHFKVERQNTSWVLNYYDQLFKLKGSIRISEVQKLFWTREPDWIIEIHTPRRTWNLKLEFKENAKPGDNLRELRKWIIGLNEWGKFANPNFEICDPPEQKDIEKVQQTKQTNPTEPTEKSSKNAQKPSKSDDNKEKKVVMKEEEEPKAPMKKDFGIPVREKKTQVQEANPVQIRCYVPEWEAEALLPSGDFTVVKSSDFKNRYLVVFFYPQDFTQVCPTELLAFSASANQFLNNDCDIIAVSVDTKYSHAAWKNVPRSQGGISGVNIPLIADNTKLLAKMFGVYLPEQGITLRGSFIIDSKNVLRSSIINDTQVGRSVSETLRLIEAFQFSDEHGEVCPVNWRKGEDTINESDKKKYFQKTYGTKALLTDKVYKNEKMKGMEQFM